MIYLHVADFIFCYVSLLCVVCENKILNLSNILSFVDILKYIFFYKVTSKVNEWESASDDSGVEEATKVDEKITPADVKNIPPPKAQAKSKAVSLQIL